MLNKSTPFTFINALNAHEYLTTDNSYVRFLVNRFYSYFQDTILVANNANKYGEVIDNQEHFDYYFSLVRKKKRFPTWHKSKQSDLVKAISEVFDYSIKKSIEVLELFDESQREEILEFHKRNQE